MASDHTRTAILAAAERLYADRGFGDVTLRDIVAEANVNLAAVNYHFGSKDELIAELFVTRSLATNRERLIALKAAEEKGGGRAPIDAALDAGFGRFRPVRMTALAMIIGMVPMALGFGEGGEQNAPLGRAVIGGLTAGTVATLFFVPAVFALLHRKTRAPEAAA
jgi:AcrR family transcriptional regulator